jgi:hypothetical protein
VTKKSKISRTQDRQPMLMLVCGETGIGKTYRTVQEIAQYVQDNEQSGKKARKVLAFDVNDDDFTMFPTVHPDHLDQFKQTIARRVRPLTKYGAMMTLTEKRSVVEQMVANFKSGLLVLEDIDKFMVGAKGQAVVGILCANRHSDLDILISHQSIAKITTTEWQNATWLRLHKQVDDIYRYRGRIPNYPLVRIATFIIEEQYDLANKAFESGQINELEFLTRKSFFLYVDMRRLKLHGCSRKTFIRAAKRYVDQEEGRKVKMLMQETNAHGKAVHHSRTDAVISCISGLLRHHQEKFINPIEET